MSHTVDFWFEYASTYSYLAAARLRPLADQAGVTVRWRPFLLGPIFQAQGLTTSPFNVYPQKGAYMWRDMERLCARYGLPLVPASQRQAMRFPQNSVLAARVALIGFKEGWGEAFTQQIYRAQFGEGRDIGDTATIRSVLQALSLDPDDVLARAITDDNKRALRLETEAAQRLNIFGAPSFVVNGELFWGNDRLEDALAWAKRA